MNVFSAVLLVVFAVMGVMSFIYYLSYFLFRYKKDASIMLITPVEGRCNDAELMLRSAAARIKWVCRGRHDYVICLDCNMDDETKKICEEICKEYGFVKLMNKNELLEMLK